MKIEKLTENKIRIILKSEDFKDKNIDLHTIMTKTAESQGLFLEILNKAKKEVGFDTEGCKLLIEAFSSSDDIYVFTVTKFSPEKEDTNKINSNKRLKVKRKQITPTSKMSIYEFSNFDNFTCFCELLNNSKVINLRGLMQTSTLYIYKNLYYLVITNMNSKHKNIKSFNSYITEFGKIVSNSESFVHKLQEHGKVIMKKNAIYTGIKYFG